MRSITASVAYSPVTLPKALSASDSAAAAQSAASSPERAPRRLYAVVRLRHRLVLPQIGERDVGQREIARRR